MKGDLEKKAIDMKKMEIMKDMEGVFESIESRELVDVPESVFKSKFLGTNKPGLTPTSVAEFAKVAGSYYKGVNVVDDITGEKLFETPGILEYPDMDSVSDVKNADASDIVNKTNNDLTDGKAVTALDKHINKTADVIVDKITEASDKTKGKWKAIFDKYNKEDEFGYDESAPDVEDDVDYS